MTQIARKVFKVLVWVLVGLTGAGACFGAEKNKRHEHMLGDALKLVPKDSRLPIARFVFVDNVDAYFASAEENERRAMHEFAMFTYSRDGADLVYLNINHVFFREAEEGDIRFGSLSGFRYALAAMIAHEVCHISQPKTQRHEIPCYETELRVFHHFVDAGYLNHARDWAARTERNLRDEIRVQQLSAAK